MERKTFPAFLVKLDEDQGIVEAIVAVMGNVDQGDDVIHNGAFAKTLIERGMKVRVLDQHNTDSIMRVLGKPLSMREIGRNELPPDLLTKYPDATGGLWTRTQYLLNTPEGKGAFERIKTGAVDEYSIGYDAMKGGTDYSKTTDGRTVRNLRDLKLYEYSPVLWAMNSATSTLSAKAGPTEGKPYGAVEEDGKWCVYKLDEDGQPTGERLGEHDTEDEAQAQVRALYANENEGEKEMTPFGPVQRLGDVLQGSIHRIFTMMCDDWYTMGYLSREQRIQLSGLIGGALDVLSQGMPEEIAMLELGGHPFMMMAGPAATENKAGRVMAARNAARVGQIRKLLDELLEDAGMMPMEDEEDDEEESPAPDKAADKKADAAMAGPGGETAEPPTSDEMLKLIDINLSEITLLEV